MPQYGTVKYCVIQTTYQGDQCKSGFRGTWVFQLEANSIVCQAVSFSLTRSNLPEFLLPQMAQAGLVRLLEGLVAIECPIIRKITYYG